MTMKTRRESFFVSSIFFLSSIYHANSLDAAQVANVTETLRDLRFSVVGPRQVRLPQDTAVLRVIRNGTDDVSDLKYHWELLSGTGSASASTYNEQELTLNSLKEGSLVFRVRVSNITHSGQAEVRLAILPPKTPNQPPVAIIRPESPVKAVAGSLVVLDAQGSRDDEQISSFKWVQDDGPSVPLPDTNSAVLRLDDMLPGEYTFTVLVTDVESLQANASVKVLVSDERDDPPQARITECGKEESGTVYIRLPVSEVALCANSSTDDKGIVSYSWFRVDKLAAKLSVDISGSSTSVLVLRNVQDNELLGPYEFEVKVVDTKGQTDSTKISLFVNKAENMPPVADAGRNHTLLLPESSVVLDGNVKDDGTIVSYEWTQIEGPSESVLTNEDRLKATASDLEEGIYLFRLSVMDDGGLNSTDDVWINVQRSKNEAPIAKATNLTVYLPNSVVALDGSISTDDAGVIDFLWTPHDDVPASMMTVNASATKAVMLVTGLVPGIHVYNLTVWDQQRASDSILVQIRVEQGEEDLESVEFIVKRAISEWTHRSKRKLTAMVESLIASHIEEVESVRIYFTAAQSMADNSMRTVFHAVANRPPVEMRRRSIESATGSGLLSSKGIVQAQRIVEVLRQEDRMLLQEFGIQEIQTLYCKLDCSSHGKCSNVTKQCVCDRFWMPSLLGFMANGGRTYDCGWSSVYFWLSSIFCASWVVLCFLAKRRSNVWSKVTRRRFRRRRRYSPVRSDTDEKEDARLQRNNRVKLEPIPIRSSSDSMHSESDDLLTTRDVKVIRDNQGIYS